MTRHEAWRILARHQLVDAYPWLRLWREVVELPDHRVVEDYHILETPDFALAVAFTRDGQVVVERHYRHGVRRVVLGLPAGQVEPGEEPLAAAKRELLEETGYAGGAWRRLGTFAVSDTRGGGQGHFFMARGVELAAEPNSKDLERSEVLLLPPNRFLEAIVAGEVADAFAVAAFLLARTGRRRSPADGTREKLT